MEDPNNNDQVAPAPAVPGVPDAAGVAPVTEGLQTTVEDNISTI